MNCSFLAIALVVVRTISFQIYNEVADGEQFSLSESEHNFIAKKWEAIVQTETDSMENLRMGYSRSYCNTSPSIYLGLLQIAGFLLLLLPESFQAVDAQPGTITYYY